MLKSKFSKYSTVRIKGDTRPDNYIGPWIISGLYGTLCENCGHPLPHDDKRIEREMAQNHEVCLGPTHPDFLNGFSSSSPDKQGRTLPEET